MEEPENNGGERGTKFDRNPSRLRPSELALLRRMSDRFPITQEDRIRAVSCVNDCIADTEARWRDRISGVKTLAELERVNLAEVGMAMDAGPTSSGITVNTTITTVSATVQEALRDPKYLEYLELQHQSAPISTNCEQPMPGLFRGEQSENQGPRLVDDDSQ